MGSGPASDLAARADALRALLLLTAEAGELTREDRDALAALENHLRALLETHRPDVRSKFFT